MTARRQLETLLLDLGYALRLLRKSPGFAAIAIGILALGIGANTAIFSAVNSVLFARWSVPSQDQLVLVREPVTGNEGFVVSVPDFEDYRRRQSTFQQLSLWVGQSINLTGREHPDRLIGAFVSANFFELLGVKTAMGRAFLPQDDQPGADPVTILSYGAWQSRFGSDPGLLGGQITLNNARYTVVGVLPKDFFLPVSPSEVFLPAHQYPDYREDRQTRSFLVFGRMKDGVTTQQATADLNTIAQGLARDYPNENAGIRTELTGLPELSTEKIRAPLLALLGAATVILLIVCANIANLLLARGAGRRHEVAIRYALGAGHGRLIRQFLSESLLLAVMGGGGGILLAGLLMKILQRISPVDVSVNPSDAATLDVRVLLFTAGISLLTGILVGAAPAMQFARINLSPILAGAGRTIGFSPNDRLRSVFVVGQLAMSLSLLVSGGLLVRSFHQLIITSPGFTPDHLLSMEYRLPANKYKTAESQWNFHHRMRDQVSRVPGVASAAIVQSLPFSGNWGQISLDPPGNVLPSPENTPTAFSNPVTPEYFSTMEIPLLKGRLFDDHDSGSAVPVVIVSRSFAQRYFPGQDPLGREVKIKDSELTTIGDQNSRRAVIVGVVGSARQRNLRETIQPQIYFSYAQVTGTFGTLVLRTKIDPAELTDSVRQAVWTVDKDQPVWKIRTVDSLIARDVAPIRFVMLLMSAFSLLALLLSALGTYAMLSHAVSMRTRELGIRMALGAGRPGLMKLVLLQSARLLMAGIALGIAGAIISGRLLAGLLYKTDAADSATLIPGVAILGVIALLASYLPARRATMVDPVVALRNE